MQKVNLDLVPEGVNPIVYASQNDDQRTIRFELVVSSFGGYWSLNGSETITAKITKPDGTAITIPITNPGSGKHYVDLVNSASDYDQDGVYLGEISFLSYSTDVIGTGNFVLKAETDPYDGKVQRKFVIDNPASFTTSLSDVLLTCRCKIDDANGIDNIDVVNAGPTYAMNSVPYQYRQTPITANRCLEKLIGVSCAFNQLVQNGNFASSSNWSATNGTLNVASNIATVTATGDAYIRQDGFSIPANHVCFISGELTVNDSNAIINYQGYTQEWSSCLNTNSSSVVIAKPTATLSRLLCAVVGHTSSGDVLKYKNIQIIDLTACFGSEVADYLYNLENS